MKHFMSTLLILLFPVALVHAETPEEKGLAIAKEIDTRDVGFVKHSADLTMKLKNRHGQTSERSMRMKTLEGKKEGDKSVIIFDNPRDVKGTAMLTHTYKTKTDDQWLYLPALKRVKRIASKNKSGPFMGSEFAYEDLNSQEVEKYTYKYIKDDTLEGKKVFVVERYPVDKWSGYTKQVAYIDQERYIPLKMVFYDRKEALLKTMTFNSYQQYKNKYWRADEFHMVNHQKGKETWLTFKNYDFDIKVSDRDFHHNSLKRAR